MTESQAVNQVQTTETKPSDKEFNFRKIEAQKNEALQRLEQERQARLDLERKLQEMQSHKIQSNDEDDDNDDDPYVDKKKLNRKLSSFEKKLEERFEKKVDERARALMDQKEEENWMKTNNDFYDVLNEDNLSKLVSKAPGMVESIKRIPDGFEKQKLVYNAIKSMGIDKPEPKQSAIQDTINSNRRHPGYQSSGVGSAPYGMSGDFSAAGQKNSYNKMQELKSRLRGM